MRHVGLLSLDVWPSINPSNDAGEVESDCLPSSSFTLRELFAIRDIRIQNEYADEMSERVRVLGVTLD